MILEFDLGNTRIKWRLRSQDHCVCRGTLLTSQSLNEIEPLLKSNKDKIERVCVASVVDASLEFKLAQWCANYLSISPEYARTKDSYSGLINGYDTPGALGVDRWLGMVACYCQTDKAFLLASFGTAITVDLVMNNGGHVGGFIAPGLNLMLDSLELNTRQVRPDRRIMDFGCLPGTSTGAAVSGAVSAMVIGLIENGLAQLKQGNPKEEIDIIFAGGDALKFLPFYPRARYSPELVLDGLAYVFNNSN